VLATTNGEYYLDDDEAQNNLPKCLTFPHSGSFLRAEFEISPKNQSRGKAKSLFPKFMLLLFGVH